MPPLRLAAILALAAFGCIVGCGDAPVSPAAVAPCRDERLVFTIVGGASPTISWLPNCRLGGMTVFEQGPFATEPVRWGIRREGGAGGGFVSPVRFGILPNGAELSQAPRELIPGTAYRLMVVFITPEPQTSALRAFSNTFTQCGAAMGECATDGMEYFRTPSPEGLRFEIVVESPSTARGDSVRLVGRVINPGATAATWTGCDGALFVFQRPGVRVERPIVACAPGGAITFAPGEMREYAILERGLVGIAPWRYSCMPAGEWNVSFATLRWSGERRSGSALARWTLVDRLPAEGSCVET